MLDPSGRSGGFDMKVASILRQKGHDVVTVKPSTSITSVVAELRTRRIGCLVVSEDGLTPVGIISERDIVNGLAVYGIWLLDLHVSDLMTHRLITCHPEDTVNHVMSEMTEHRIRHLPVVDRGQLVGMISIGDVVKHRVNELETEANILREAFIARH